jgi:hypothetical protein
VLLAPAATAHGSRQSKAGVFSGGTFCSLNRESCAIQRRFAHFGGSPPPPIQSSEDRQEELEVLGMTRTPRISPIPSIQTVRGTRKSTTDQSRRFGRSNPSEANSSRSKAGARVTGGRQAPASVRAADLLQNEAEIVAYIDGMLADGDDRVLPIALRTVLDTLLGLQRSRNAK